MFCPRCGQQAAEEVRFCSRCGLPLDAAAELVEAGGRPDWARAEADASAPLTPRQRGKRQALIVAAGGLLFFVIALLLTAYKEDLFVFLIGAGIVIVFGFVRLLYALLLETDTPRGKTSPRLGAESAAELKRGSARRKELPDARSVPASLYADAAADTKDMSASPLSVTESTTRLLDRDEDGRGR
jgi:hypothetical protein